MSKQKYSICSTCCINAFALKRTTFSSAESALSEDAAQLSDACACPLNSKWRRAGDIDPAVTLLTNDTLSCEHHYLCLCLL